jgi:hypothetical protein
LTALLFVVGQLLLGWYLGRQSSASVYGAAGSLIVLLLWIYYSAQIFLFGAEFTQVFATRYGQGVQPDSATVPRGSQDVVKPAAMAAGGDHSGRPTRSMALKAGSHANGNGRGVWQPPADPHENLFGLGGLATDLVGDLGALARMEMQLIRTEIKEAAVAAGRGAAFTAGGGLALYGAVLLVLSCIALVLAGLMPAWLAALLVGLLLMIEGWVLTVAARRKLRELAQTPKHTTESIAQDIAMVKEHVAN